MPNLPSLKQLKFSVT